ncbi:B12-binding domain-containing radical SAM protein [Candidatus Bipolaricaulota sp. J31]
MEKLERVVLIEPKSGTHFFSYARMPLLGLPILGEILRRLGLKVRIFCENLAPIDWEEVARVDLVGISVLTNLAPRAYRIARKVKEIAAETKRRIWVVMGGPHASFLPEEALRAGADFVIRHEGEESLPLLVKYLRGRGDRELEEIPGLSYRKGEEIVHNPGRPLVRDLDSLPFPNFSLIKGAERMNIVPFQTSRGCPHDCEFCSVVQMFGRKIRYRSPEGVIEGLKRIKEAFPGRHVFFVDDNFSAHTERALSLLEAMARARLGISWSVQERVSVGGKPEVLRLMRETGCTRLYMGIESFNPEVLREWGKGQTPEEIEEAIRKIHREGLLVHGMFVLGGDTDTPETIRHTVRKAIELGIDTAQFFVLVPPPGTRLYQRLDREGRIFDKDWAHYNGHYVVFRPKNMSPWELQALVLWAYRKFYAPWRGIKSLLWGRWRNVLPSFYGRWVLRRWLRENRGYLLALRERWAAG